MKLIHYVPKYEDMDKFISFFGDKPIINFFVDFKNTLMWDPNVASMPEEMLSSLISETLNLVAYIKRYIKERNGIDKPIRFIFFTEQGKSMYHKRVIPEYKDNRQKDLAMGIQQDYFRTIAFAVKIMSSLFNYIPNITFLRGDCFEYDLIPHLFLKSFIKENESNILFSCDRDHIQTVIKYKNRIIQYDKSKFMGARNKAKRFAMFLIEENALVRYYKELPPPEESEVLKEYFCLIRALEGDGGDGISGVNGIGSVKARSHLLTIKQADAIIPMDEIREYLYNNDLETIKTETLNGVFSIYKHTNFKLSKSDTEKRKSKAYTIMTSKENQYRMLRNILAMDYDVIINKNKLEMDSIKDNLMKYESEKIYDCNTIIETLSKCKGFDKQLLINGIDWQGVYL